MKKTFTLLLLAMFSIMQSCEKHDESPKNATLNVTLASGEDYRLDLKQYGKNNSTATITTQAVNYSISEIESGSLTYHYQSSSKTGVTDKVALAVTKPRGRCGNGNDDDDDEEDATNVTINFTIK